MFERTEIKVKKETGEELCQAIIHPLSKDLAVVMTGFGYFTVTHIKTGLKISGAYDRVSNAMLNYAEWILITKEYDIDWNIETITELMSVIGDKPVPFKEATSTQNGETRPMTIKEWTRYSLLYPSVWE